MCSRCKRKGIAELEARYRAAIQRFMKKWLPHLSCDGAREHAASDLAELMLEVLE